MFAAHVFAGLSDDDDQLAFVVELGRPRTRGNRNGRAGILQCVRAFRKQHGIIAGAHAHFGCMLAIVLPNAPNHDRDYRSQDFYNARRLLGDAIIAEGIAFHSQVRAAGLLRGILDF